ncbi:hypothetical protein NC99_22330 [Sunxiuqinia dokdonensis]|uniref:Uncharacterized protein n=1 Tax=Sunxiuqinia dokdonensis TaxID=1409788 RepID=A0A0L8V8Z4_9BACT|nr:hypothetical protein NC99_22330 [Sunxiuqinia dokdonensis]
MKTYPVKKVPPIYHVIPDGHHDFNVWKDSQCKFVHLLFKLVVTPE